MKIKIKCPSCKKEFVIKVHSIEKLEAENSRLKSRIKELEDEKLINDLFVGIFKK